MLNIAVSSLFSLDIIGSVNGVVLCQLVLLTVANILIWMMLRAKRYFDFGCVMGLLWLLIQLSRTGSQIAANIAFTVFSLGIIADYFTMIYRVAQIKRK